METLLENQTPIPAAGGDFTTLGGWGFAVEPGNTKARTAPRSNNPWIDSA
jgi:hypothetical protein